MKMRILVVKRPYNRIAEVHREVLQSRARKQVSLIDKRVNSGGDEMFTPTLFREARGREASPPTARA